MSEIEVFAIPEYIVLQKGNESLWCNRNDGTLRPQLGKCYKSKCQKEKNYRSICMYNPATVLRSSTRFLSLGYDVKRCPNVVKVDTTCKCFVGKLKLLSGTVELGAAIPMLYYCRE